MWQKSEDCWQTTITKEKEDKMPFTAEEIHIRSVRAIATQLADTICVINACIEEASNKGLFGTIIENLPLDRVPKLRDFYANYGYSTRILEEASKLLIAW